MDRDIRRKWETLEFSINPKNKNIRNPTENDIPGRRNRIKKNIEVKIVFEKHKVEPNFLESMGHVKKKKGCKILKEKLAPDGRRHKYSVKEFEFSCLVSGWSVGGCCFYINKFYCTSIF